MRDSFHGRLRAYGADEPHASRAFHRKDCEEVRIIECDVELAVGDRAARLDIGDVEEVRIGAAEERGAESLPDPGVSAIAAREEHHLARFGRAAVPGQLHTHRRTGVCEAGDRGPALDFDSGG